MPKESVVKRVTKKKVVKKVTKKTARSAPKKRAVSSTVSTKRKAPTRTSAILEKPAVLHRSKKGILIAVLSFLIVSAGSVAIGFSDSGEIGVSEVVSQKAEKLIEKGDIAAAERITIPKAETASRPNGGLSGKGKPPPPPPPPVSASSTASTTESISEDAAVEESEIKTVITDLVNETAENSDTVVESVNSEG